MQGKRSYCTILSVILRVVVAKSYCILHSLTVVQSAANYCTVFYCAVRIVAVVNRRQRTECATAQSNDTTLSLRTRSCSSRSRTSLSTSAESFFSICSMRCSAVVSSSVLGTHLEAYESALSSSRCLEVSRPGGEEGCAVGLATGASWLEADGAAWLVADDVAGVAGAGASSAG